MTHKASGTGDMEIELKLVIDPADGAALARSPVLADITPDDSAQSTTYFDTPDGALRDKGLSLRVRRIGERYIQTIKAAGTGAAGIFARDEWEHDVAGPAPDLGGSSPLGAMVDAAVLARIAPVFSVTVRRRAWQVVDDDAEIELVLDEGTVLAAGRQAPFAEIEAELKGGAPAALFALARRLGSEVPLRLGVLTKAERGYRLADGKLGAPAKAAPLSIDPAADVAAAIAAIVGGCLRQFRLNEDVLRTRDDPKALHQTRVALRRLRAALSLFKPVLNDGCFATVAAGLRDLARALGEARDLDVVIDSLDTQAPDSLTAARDHAYAAARDALDAQDTRDLMIALVAWITLGDWRLRPADDEAVGQPAATFAAAAMTTLRRRLKKRGKHLATLGDEARHEVRKLAKKARYATEFFAPLVTGKKARRRHKKFGKKLAALQAHLGALNDLAVAPALLARFGLADHPVDGEARERLLRKAAKAHKALMKTKRFWSAGG